MNSVSEIRSFLEKYHAREIGDHNPPSQDRIPFDGVVAAKQKAQWGYADEHRIPIAEYEIRLNEDDDPPQHEDEFRIPSAIFAVEDWWDASIKESGLTSLAEYIPFHESSEEYGIYIRQQGLRLLGHLFYDWSRVMTLGSGYREQTEILQQKPLSETNELLFHQPAFESRREAFEFAREFLIRYLWFLHQLEILASYIEDLTGDLCWGTFYDHEKPGVGEELTLIEKAAISYAIRSSALSNVTPDGVSRMLLGFRAFFTRCQSPRLFEELVDRHYETCKEISSIMSQETQSHPSESFGGLGRELPFSHNPYAASPGKLPIYITRNEFDPDNGVNGRGIVLETDWDIVESEDWEETYKSASPEMKRAADNARSKLEKNVKHGGFKWEQCRPDNQWYFRLNKEFRGVALIDNQSERITLLNFGKHDSPSKFGCY